MREKWFVFDGIAVFDHEIHNFWHRREIKELGLKYWENMEMNDIRKNPTNSDLSYLLRQELDYYSDAKTYKHKYWDDEGRWELIEIPYNIGFGIIQGDTERFIELADEYRKNN